MLILSPGDLSSEGVPCDPGTDGVAIWSHLRAIIELLLLGPLQPTFSPKRLLFAAWTKPLLVLAVPQSGLNQLSLMTSVASLYQSVSRGTVTALYVTSDGGANPSHGLQRGVEGRKRI